MKTINQPDFFDLAGKPAAEARGIVGKVIDRIRAIGKKKKPEAKPDKKRKAQPAPVWRDFMLAADGRIKARGGYKLGFNTKTMEEFNAAEIVAHGDGEAFLKAVRRGRSTQRQNLRYQLLREVERLMGDAVPRRRPDANTPDSVALKGRVRLELEAYTAAGRQKNRET